MSIKNVTPTIQWNLVLIVLCLVCTAGCARTYYRAMEKVGIHKRDILVSRVEDARDAQEEAQEQFKSALQRFGEVVRIEETDLKKAYDKLNSEYEESRDAASEVSERIKSVESVADALFQEWEEELTLYSRDSLRRSSQKKLSETKSKYRKMLASMHQAEKSMTPVLNTFQDNVLFLKHNLNAQAIGSLKSEFNTLKTQIDGLIQNMNHAIERSNRFIEDIHSSK